MKLDFMRTCAGIADLVLPLGSDSIAYWEIFDDTATRRLGATESIRRVCRQATCCRCK